MKFAATTPYSILVFLSFYSGPSHAYLDPGTGSLLLQVLLGGIAGLLVAGKLMWARILGLFGIAKNESPEAGSESED